MLQYELTAGAYVAPNVSVSARALCERVAQLIASGVEPGAAFERLLDEREWGDIAEVAAKRARHEAAEELPEVGSLVPLSVASGAERLSFRGRVLARAAGRLDLRIVPAPTGAARLMGALVQLPAPHGRRLLGQVESADATGWVRLNVIRPAQQTRGERRLAPRYLPLVATRGYALMDGDEQGAELRVTLTDLGPSGFGFIAPHPLPAGMPVALRLPGEHDGEQRIIAGSVVWLSRAAGGWRVGASTRA